MHSDATNAPGPVVRGALATGHADGIGPARSRKLGRTTGRSQALRIALNPASLRRIRFTESSVRGTAGAWDGQTSWHGLISVGRTWHGTGMRQVPVLRSGGMRQVTYGRTAGILGHAHICLGSGVEVTLLGLTPRHAARRANRRMKRLAGEDVWCCD